MQGQRETADATDKTPQATRGMHKHAWGRDGEDTEKTWEEPTINDRHFVKTCQLHSVLLQPCGREAPISTKLYSNTKTA